MVIVVRLRLFGKVVDSLRRIEVLVSFLVANCMR